MIQTKQAVEIEPPIGPVTRFAVSALLVAFAYWTVPLLLGVLHHFIGYPHEVWANLFCSGALLLLILLWMSSLFARLFEGMPLAAVGIGFVGRWKSEAGVGVGIGASMILLVAAAERLLGLATFAETPHAPIRVLENGVFLFAALVVAAANEELMFRGYPFQRLVEVIGPAGAVVAGSVVFGLSHLGNPFRTWLSTVNTMLVGVPLSLAYLRTRALWMPIGIHFAWNFFQGYALGLPVSGMLLPGAFFKPELHAGAWLTGGSYGPEGGLLALLAIVAATIYIGFAGSIQMSGEMRELLRGAGSIPRRGSEGLSARSRIGDQAGEGQRRQR